MASIDMSQDSGQQATHGYDSAAANSPIRPRPDDSQGGIQRGAVFFWLVMSAAALFMLFFGFS
jgi:hypothetical protein